MAEDGLPSPRPANAQNRTFHWGTCMPLRVNAAKRHFPPLYAIFKAHTYQLGRRHALPLKKAPVGGLSALSYSQPATSRLGVQSRLQNTAEKTNAQPSRPKPGPSQAARKTSWRPRAPGKPPSGQAGARRPDCSRVCAARACQGGGCWGGGEGVSWRGTPLTPTNNPERGRGAISSSRSKPLSR